MKLLSTLFLFFFITFCFGQTETTKNEFFEVHDIVLSENQLYGIEKNGHLIKWDLKTGVREDMNYDTLQKITSITTDRNSNIILGTDKGRLFEISSGNKDLVLKLRLKKEAEIKDILINSKNEIFLIVPNAIYDPVKDKYWENFIHNNSQLIVKKKFLLFFWKRTNRYFQMPQNTFVDSNDVIWMTSSYGEFGGSIQRFDTKNRKEINTSIDNLKLSMLFPQNVFSDDERNIYISSGLQHFTNFGEIWKIQDGKAEIIFESDDFKDQYPNELFVGPSLIDPKTNIIYITTNEGVFKAKLPEDGKIKNIELLFVPELFWDREPLAIGAKMSIRKLLVTKDGKLIFLTSKNGVGIYNNGNLKYLK